MKKLFLTTSLLIGVLIFNASGRPPITFSKSHWSWFNSWNYDKVVQTELRTAEGEVLSIHVKCTGTNNTVCEVYSALNSNGGNTEGYNTAEINFINNTIMQDLELLSQSNSSGTSTYNQSYTLNGINYSVHYSVSWSTNSNGEATINIVATNN